MLNWGLGFGIILVLSNAAADVKCGPDQVNPEFLVLKKEVEARIERFANQKSVAQAADQLLSSLIAAKSPVMTTWIQKRNLLSQSEEEIARAWRSYFARNLILTKYPHASAGLNREIEKLVGDVLSDYAKPAFKTKMEALFSRVKEASLKTVRNFSLPEKTKKELSGRIQAIKLYWVKDLKSARNNSIPLDIIDWGIAYDPSANEVNMGLNAAAYPNDETYFAVFAHEIGHSFDSCRWGAYFQGDWPFSKVGECLRSKKSVGAKARDDRELARLTQSGQLSKEMAASLKANPTCNRLSYPPPGVQADQLPEAFADWFSAEVVAGMGLSNVAGLRSDLCEEKALMEGSSYPSNEVRLNRIYFAQPLLRAKAAEMSGLKKGGGGEYCLFVKP